jgi:hypothetical protein
MPPEERDKPLFENAQWKVTTWGLECKTHRYEIEGKRLLALGIGNRSDVYDLVVHVAEKEWVELLLFFEAFDQATSLYRGTLLPEFDRKEHRTRLRLTFGKAVEEWISCREPL